MTEAEVDPARPPRFPYVAALLCAACIGAAVWTWMVYSYAWDVEPKDIRSADELGFPPNRYVGRYVRLRGVSESAGGLLPSDHGPLETDYPVLDPSDRAVAVCVCSGGADAPAPGTSVAVCGQVVLSFTGLYLIVDSTHSRWHGASIAGLVVGAMGVFVFSVALRHWLRERRDITELETS